MSWLAFVASVVSSLAWPSVVAAAVVVLPRPIGDALSRGVHRLRAGPIEVVFDRELTAIGTEISETATKAAPEAAQLSRELSRLVELSPRVAVLEAFTRVEARLSQMLEDRSDVWLAPGLGLMKAQVAHQRGWISDETLKAIEGLATLRDLIIHTPDVDLGTRRARDYIALADAILVTLGSEDRDSFPSS